MKLTIELDAEYGISEDDKKILLALAGVCAQTDLSIEEIKPIELPQGEMLEKGHVANPAKHAAAIASGVIVELPASGEIATKVTNDNVAQISERADLADPKHQTPANSAAGMVTQQAGNLTPNATTQAAAVTPALDVTGLDSKGMPWDARIHSSRKTKLKKDDSWKLKAGIEKKSPGLVAQVEAENRAKLATQPVEVELGTVEPVQTAAAQVFGQPAATVEQIVPDTLATTEQITLAQLLQTITPRQISNPEYATVINNVLIEFGLKSLTDLAGLPDLIPPIYNRLNELWQG